jgi:cysteine desulfurase
MNKEFLYFDNHSTTPMAPEALEAMLPYFIDKHGNPASQGHWLGWQADEAVRIAREQVAALITATDPEIYFTSGATESNNLALKGVIESLDPSRYDGLPHIISTAIEHKSVLAPLQWLEQKGYAKVTLLQPDAHGYIAPSLVAGALTQNTCLVSVMWANNEVGTIQPIQEIGAICKERQVLFHSDATQVPSWCAIDVNQAGVDLLSLSAHKFCGPKGVGALFVRRKNPRVHIQPLLHGGGHERGLRSGTLNVPGIVGMGVAAKLARLNCNNDSHRIAKLRDQLQQLLHKSGLKLRVNGHPTERLANNLNVSFFNINAELFLANLSRHIAVSGASACASNGDQSSYVLAAMGLKDSNSTATIRMGLGTKTTDEQIHQAARIVTDSAVNSLLKSI